MVEVLDSDDDFVETPHRVRAVLKNTANNFAKFKVKAHGSPLSKAAKRRKAVCSAPEVVAIGESSKPAAPEPVRLVESLTIRSGTDLRSSHAILCRAGASTGRDTIIISDSEDDASNA